MEIRKVGGKVIKDSCMISFESDESQAQLSSKSGGLALIPFILVSGLLSFSVSHSSNKYFAVS